jgi:peptidoglycan/xylan/chitin deacetylase (PgdA/CDA1 family)
MPFSILMYHDISPAQSVVSVPGQLFANQMMWLKEQNYQVLSFNEAARRIREQKELPARTVVITFDDGLASVYHVAFPILKEHGFPATVFIVSGSIGQENSWQGQPAAIPSLPMMSWAQIQEMDRHEIEIGSHTVTHPRLDRLSPAQQEIEIQSSKTCLEERLGHSIESFAFPYGSWDQTSLAMVRDHHSCACTTFLALVDLTIDPFLIPRIDAYYLKNPAFFHLLSSQMIRPYIAIRRFFRQVRSGIIYSK